MSEKRKSYRERYFEDYELVRLPSNNRRGWREEYRYIGRWAQWEDEKRPLWKRKLFISVLELLSAAVYVAAALSGAELNRSRLANGFGVLSLLPWILELSGVIRFAASGSFVRELTAEEIGKTLRAGCVLRFGLVLLSGIAGLIAVLRGGLFSLRESLAFLGLIVSAGLSLAVKRIYDGLLLNLYRNDNGQPGENIDFCLSRHRAGRKRKTSFCAF